MILLLACLVAPPGATEGPRGSSPTDTAGADHDGTDTMDLNFGRAWEAGNSGCGWSWVFAEDAADGSSEPRTALLNFHLDLSAIDQTTEADFHATRSLGATDSLQLALPGGESNFFVRDCMDSGLATNGRVWTAESATVEVAAAFSHEQTIGFYGAFDAPLAVYDAEIDLTDLTFVSDDGYTASYAEVGPLVLQIGWGW